MSEQAGRYQRSFGGMIGALLVLLLLIGAFVVFRDVNRSDPVAQVRTVDYEQPAELARESARFRVLVPERLPDGWAATSVRFSEDQGQSWHLGLLTGSRRYVGLEQAERPESAMVAEFVDEDAVRGDDVQVAGRSWTTYTDAGGDVALVRQQGDVTTLVVGTVPLDVLDDFVATLR